MQNMSTPNEPDHKNADEDADSRFMKFASESRIYRRGIDENIY